MVRASTGCPRRQSSRLLRLGSGAEVIKRVDFRNTGPDQTPVLIVMTVDDGSKAGADLIRPSTAWW